MGRKPLQPLVFGHRAEVIKEAVADYGQDIRRMKTCLRGAGYEASDEDLAAAWLSYSENVAAGWLDLPDSDRQLLVTLLEGKAPLLVAKSPLRQHWAASLVDAGDGSGDQILELPDDLMAALGWAIDDILEVSRLPSGDIRLHKL